MSIFLKNYKKPSQLREGFVDTESIRKRVLHELEINGKNVDDDDNFTMDEEDETGKAENGTETPEDAANNVADNQANAEENDTQTQNDNGSGDTDDNFTLTDQDLEGDNASENNQEQGGDANDNQEANTTDNQDSGEDNNGAATDDANNDQSADDNFTLDDSNSPTDDQAAGDENGQEAAGGNDEAGTDDSAADAGTADDSAADKSGSLEDDDVKAAEEQIYDSLTDDQKRIRLLQLKIDYRDLYDTLMNSINSINSIPKTTNSIPIIKKLSDFLIRTKMILIDYIQNNFDGSSYMDNYVNFIKFIAIFRTATKVLNNISNIDK